MSSCRGGQAHIVAIFLPPWGYIGVMVTGCGYWPRPGGVILDRLCRPIVTSQGLAKDLDPKDLDLKDLDPKHLDPRDAVRC